MYQTSLARRPADWAIQANFANFLRTTGKKLEAAAAYAEAVRLMPVFAPLRVQYAQVLADLGRRAEAIRELEEALRFQPELRAARDGLRQLTRNR
jgi:predicted Zn-dependent protease